jgi:Flavin reductase like domain
LLEKEGGEVMFRLRCETYRTVQVEDHQFWVGKVVKVENGGAEEAKRGGGEEWFSLMYSDRHFRDVGEIVVPDGRAGEDEVVEQEIEGEGKER